jgi:hypothetical protein
MRRGTPSRAAIIGLAAVLAANTIPALAQTPNAKAAVSTQARRPQLDRNSVFILVRGAMATLDNANKTGNYSVMRDLAAPAFAAANDPSRLAEIFANLRRNKIDLSGTLVLEPQLTQLPEYDKNGNIHISGFFPSAPMQVNFQLIFAPVSGQWRLIGITTDVGASGPVAPAISQIDSTLLRTDIDEGK